MQLQEREIEIQTALKRRITGYLEEKIPVALSKGIKRQRKGLSFKASLRLHRWVTVQMFELDIFRWLQCEIARIAGNAYVTDTASLMLTGHHKTVRFTLPHTNS